MNVSKKFLNADMIVRTRFAFSWIDAHTANFIEPRLIDLNRRHETEFVVRRFKGGVALDHGGGKNNRLHKYGLIRAAK